MSLPSQQSRLKFWLMVISSAIFGGKPPGLEPITVSIFLGFIIHQWGGCISFNPKDGDTWMWKDPLGWLWTDLDVFPYFFIQSIQDWGYSGSDSKKWTVLLI